MANEMPNWMNYIPAMSAGLGGLGAIFNLVQNIQRMKQMSDLRKFYMGGWEKSANQALSRLAGDAASRGWSGFPKGLADITAGAYAPYAFQAGQGAQSTVAPIAGVINPFDQFLKSLESLRSLYPNKPSDITTNFNYNSSRGPGNPVFDIPRGLDMSSIGAGITGLEGT